MTQVFLNSVIQWLDESFLLIEPDRQEESIQEKPTQEEKQDEQKNLPSSNLEIDRSLERVIWMDAAENLAVVIRFDEKAMPRTIQLSDIENALESGRAVKRSVDPRPVPVVEDSELDPKHRKLRDEGWEKISSLVTDEPDIYDPVLRGVMVRELIEKFGYRKQTLYYQMRRYWQGGKSKNALLPRYEHCGGAGKTRQASEKKRGRPSKISKEEPHMIGVNVDEETAQIFRTAISLLYNNSDQPPLTRVYEQMREKFFNIGYKTVGNVRIPIMPPDHEMPTYRQFEYWFHKEMDLKKTLTSRIGIKNFNLKKRAVLGSSAGMAMGPGSIYQIDATLADVYLISEYNPEWIIGRPVLYVVMDAFSRMVVGFHVGLEGPSWLGASHALANTFEDKVQFCKGLGVDITRDQWDVGYLPEFLLADRGEIISKASDRLVHSLNVGISNTAPYRADWKGIVEQEFRLLNLDVIQWTPGAVKSRQRARGEQDHCLDATLTLKEFAQSLVHRFKFHNLYHWMNNYSREEFMIEDDVNPVPIDLWKWGIRNRSGHLREQPSDIIRLSLLPRGKASVTEKGIRFEGMYYSCEKALSEHWFERARHFRTWSVEVAYDSRNTSHIYLVGANGKEFQVCTLLERNSKYMNRRLEEVQDLLEIENFKATLHRSRETQAKAEFHARFDHIVEAALERKKKRRNTLSKSNRIKNIRLNRSVEKERIREQEAWLLGKAAESKNKRNPPEELKSAGQVVPLAPRAGKESDELQDRRSQRDKLFALMVKKREEG